MTALLHGLSMLGLAGLLFIALGSLVTATWLPAVKARLAKVEPGARYTALVALSLAPLALGAVLMFSVSIPAFFAVWAPTLDHCVSHDDGHAHLCFVHLPHQRLGPTVMGVALVIVGYFGWRVLRTIGSASRAMRLVSSLRKTSTYDAQLDATLVDELAPFCFAAGAWRPQVLISRALWERLDDQQRTVVLAHERGHVQRRDPFLKLLVHAVSSLHVPAAGRWLVNEAAIAAEQLCDERAALIVGDRLAVASTILSLERLAQDTPALDLGPLVVAFDECAVERRVRALMAPAPQATSLQRYGLGVALFIIGLLVASESIHHVTEAALSHLTH